MAASSGSPHPGVRHPGMGRAGDQKLEGPGDNRAPLAQVLGGRVAVAFASGQQQGDESQFRADAGGGDGCVTYIQQECEKAVHRELRHRGPIRLQDGGGVKLLNPRLICGGHDRERAGVVREGCERGPSQVDACCCGGGCHDEWWCSCGGVGVVVGCCVVIMCVWLWVGDARWGEGGRTQRRVDLRDFRPAR